MEKIIKLRSIDEARKLFGNHDENLRFIEQEFSVKVVARGEDLNMAVFLFAGSEFVGGEFAGRRTCPVSLEQALSLSV